MKRFLSLFLILSLILSSCVLISCRRGDEPEDPIDPVDPESPVDPENPADPEDPADPVDPVDPEDPADPEDPTDPEVPVDPEIPVDPEVPEEPDEPEIPVIPVNPVDPVPPTDPEEPVDPTDPEQPSGEIPVIPVDPADTQAKADAAAVEALINLIPTISPNNYNSAKTYVESARAAYNKLSALAKNYVSSAALTKLISAETTLADIFAALGGGTTAYEQQAADVTAKINALPTITASNYLQVKPLVQAASAAYSNLSSDALAFISPSTITKLRRAEAEISYYESASGNPSQGGTSEQQAIAAAAQVDAILNALPTVTAENYLQVKNRVQSARDTYNAVGANVQRYVSSAAYQKLIVAESAIAAFEAINTPTQDSATIQAQNDAAAVTSKIMALDEITKTNYTAMEPLVAAARDAYNALSDLAKGYVTDLAKNKLNEAERKIDEFEAGESSGGVAGDGSIILPGDDFTNN